MNRKFPLAAVLRVRKVQEDKAAAAVAAARAELALAVQREQELEVRLDGGVAPGSATYVDWIATTSARLSLARDAAAARTARRDREAGVAEALDGWAAARAAARGVERLAERHEEAVRLEDERAEQRELDERATSRRPQVPGPEASR
ncbi:MAG: flagellar FliJ family protein [Motilibacteraceae bacterium]